MDLFNAKGNRITGDDTYEHDKEVDTGKAMLVCFPYGSRPDTGRTSL